MTPGSSDPSAAARRSLTPLVAVDGDRTRVRLDAESPGGRRLASEATVEVARLVPVPDCGKPVSEAKKSAPELQVSGFAAA